MVLEVVVASGKGGVGKSTIASSLAVIMGKELGNLVVIDADVDAPNLHLMLNVREWVDELVIRSARVAKVNADKCVGCGLCENACTNRAIKLVSGKCVINKYLCEGCGACVLVCPKKAIELYEVISGIVKVGLTEFGFPLITASLPPGRANTGKIVTEERNLARERFKGFTIVTDAAAGIGCQVIASLVGADLALLVAEPTPTSFNDLKRIHRLTKHFGIPSVLAINKYDLDQYMTDKILKFAEEEGIGVLALIPYDSNIPLSMARPTPFIIQYPESKATGGLIKLCTEILKILRNWDSWRREHRVKPIPYIPKVIKP